jgi:Tol biopolymer transport system component
MAVWCWAGVLLLICGVIWQCWPVDVRIEAFRPLTNDGRFKQGPLVSDGQRVYFTETNQGKEVAAWVSAGGGTVQLLNVPFAASHVLSLSETRKSLLVEDIDHTPYEVALDSMQVRRITYPGGLEVGAAVWDPEGRRLAMAGHNMVAIGVPGEPIQPSLVRLPGLLTMGGWLPHRSRLRVSVMEPKTNTDTWWEVEAGDPNPHPLGKMTSEQRECLGSWTSDGDFIFQTESAGSTSQIWIAEGGSKAAHRLTFDGQFWRNAAPLPGKHTILAIARAAKGQLVTLPSLGQPEVFRPVLRGISATELDYSPDRQSIAYTLYPDLSIWRCNPDGSHAQRLSPANFEAQQPHWSPDGTRIAFMGRKRTAGAKWRAYIITTAGGSLDEPAPGGDDQGVPTWSHDGSKLIFGDLLAMKEFDHASIHEVDLRTGIVSRIPAPPGMWTPRMSPDGKYLAAVSFDNHSLWMRENSRGSWTRCATMKLLEEPVWSPDATFVQFPGSTGKTQRMLYRISPQCDEPPKAIVDLAEHSCVGDVWLGVAPDGSPIALLGLPEEIYALDWSRRRHLPF